MKEISVTEAKNSFTHWVHQAEQGESIHLTRRGKAVAVILSEAQYRQLTASPKSIWAAIKDWREQVDFSGIELTDQEIDIWRERSPGREGDQIILSTL